MHISIHPMLLFIIAVSFSLISFSDFNTSHVTVYLHACIRYSSCLSYFNTSHVTVYQLLQSAPIGTVSDFNTSHVTVYQELQT